MNWKFVEKVLHYSTLSLLVDRNPTGCTQAGLPSEKCKKTAFGFLWERIVQDTVTHSCEHYFNKSIFIQIKFIDVKSHGERQIDLCFWFLFRFCG